MPTVSVKVWGPLALFSRPESPVDRVSYPIMTPSAARGVLDAILYRPEMRWQTIRITVLKPPYPGAVSRYRTTNLYRNEHKNMITPRGAVNTLEGKHLDPDKNRVRRNSLVLRHVAYRIDARPLITAKGHERKMFTPGEGEPTGTNTPEKYEEMFNRRVSRGQCFRRPYLGIREFAASFAPIDGREQVVDWTEALGPILYDLDYRPSVCRPGFFQAMIVHGVMHCDVNAPGPNGEPPIRVEGWDDAGWNFDPNITRRAS